MTNNYDEIYDEIYSKICKNMKEYLKTTIESSERVSPLIHEWSVVLENYISGKDLLVTIKGRGYRKVQLSIRFPEDVHSYGLETGRYYQNDHSQHEANPYIVEFCVESKDLKLLGYEDQIESFCRNDESDFENGFSKLIDEILRIHKILNM